MLAAARLGQVLVGEAGREPVAAWVEGGGAPIAVWIGAGRPALALALDDVGRWALAQGAAAVLVRRQWRETAYWWGPGDEIPFNKLDVEPLDALPHDARPLYRLWPQRRGGPYFAYWADRWWSSLHPDEDERRRALFDGELDELFPDPDERPSGAADVRVWRHDMFWEGPPYLRGVIRSREVAGGANWVTDAEDSANPFFHAGPPRSTRLWRT